MTNSKKTVILRSTIQVALFNNILVGQITQPDGRWFGVRTKGHAEAFEGATAKVVKGDQPLGLNFAAPKRNYNFNDSNWVNDEAVLARLMEVAVAANGGKEYPKKALAADLEDIKTILKNSAQPAPVEAAPAHAAEAA